MSVICIDIGTTRCKIAVINSQGVLLEESAFPHNAQLPDNMIDCEVIFQAIDRELLKLFSRFHNIEAITSTSFGETFVCTNQKGISISPSILYFDTRSKPQLQKLCQKYDESSIYQQTGHRLGTVSPLGKLCWMQENQKEILKKSSHILFVADYILVRLGAAPFMSKSFAVTTNWMDFNAQEQLYEILEAACVSAEKFSPVREAGDITGMMSSYFCKRYNTEMVPKLIAGGHDQPFATIGAGAMYPGEAVYGMGTSDSLNIILPDSIINHDTYQYGFQCEPYFNTSKYLTYAQIPSGGKSLTWAYSLLFSSHGNFSAKACADDIHMAISRQTDVLFFPFINGSGTPFCHTYLSGSFWGLEDKTTAHDMLLAVMEGVAFEMKLNMELLSNCGISSNRIIASGGGAQFEDWLQLRADILEAPLWINSNKNTGLFGLFAVSSISLNYFGNIEEAVKSSNSLDKIKPPTYSKANYYTEKYQRYKEIRSFIQSDLKL